MQKDKTMSLQEWLPFNAILEKGIIKLKSEEYIKLMKIIPINYNLKSDMEKEGILNSYKTFLKTCNFDIQILIQSNKEDLSKHISKIKESVKQENRLNLLKISEKYIEFINKLNNEKKSSSKNFYIIIKGAKSTEELSIGELNEKFFKIKECLSRCGNTVVEISDKEELKKILFTFFNSRKNFLA
ncbi:MAG: hypothetical protein HFJ52_08170 [Clostridia bacterium]|nr:hypothetical protein [Clostridia bacterium]